MKGVLSIAPWFGSTGDIAPIIASQFGKCDMRFFVCAGGMAEILASQPCRREVANDIHGDLINFCRVLVSEKFDRLDALLQRTLFSESLFDEAVAFLKLHSDEPPADSIRNILEQDLYRAYYTFVAWWMGKGGMAGTDSKPSLSRRYTGDGGSGGSRFRSASRQLTEFRTRMARVEFWCMDMFEMLANIQDEEGVMVYVDPPFIKGGNHYKHSLNAKPDDCGLLDDDYDRMADALKRFKKARVVLRHYEHQRIREMYSNWKSMPITSAPQGKVTSNLQSTRHKNTSNQSKAKRGEKVKSQVMEMLWCNGEILKSAA